MTYCGDDTLRVLRSTRSAATLAAWQVMNDCRWKNVQNSSPTYCDSSKWFSYNCSL